MFLNMFPHCRVIWREPCLHDHLSMWRPGSCYRKHRHEGGEERSAARTRHPSAFDWQNTNQMMSTKTTSDITAPLRVAVFRIRMKNELRSSGPSVHHLHRVTVSPVWCQVTFPSSSSPLIPCLFFAVALDSSQWWKCKIQTDASLLSRVTSESRISVSHLAFLGPQF